MISSSKRVWMGSIALTGVLLFSSLPGTHMPVKAAEPLIGSETVLKKDLSGFSAQKVRQKIVASADLTQVKKDKPSSDIQVTVAEKGSEVKSEANSPAQSEVKPEANSPAQSEVKPEAESGGASNIQSVTKPAPSTKAAPKPPQVASAAYQVSRGGTSQGATIVKNAQSLLGVPYRFGGTNRNGFDCSGFTQYVFKGSGISLPRTSYEQYNVGTPVKKDELQAGDLVFFSTYAKGASHVGIYIGGGRFIHAASKGVQTTSLSDSYYSARYLGARRVQ